MSGSVPIRDSGSEYFVPSQLFPGPAYPVYCSGGDFRLSGRTIQALRQAACHTPLFPIDDAYVGMSSPPRWRTPSSRTTCSALLCRALSCPCIVAQL
eukprot:bmy_21638T0